MDGVVFALVFVMSTGHRMETGSTYLDVRDCQAAAAAQEAADSRMRGVCEARSGLVSRAPGGHEIEARQPVVDMDRCRKEFEAAPYGGEVSASCVGR